MLSCVNMSLLIIIASLATKNIINVLRSSMQTKKPKLDFPKM